MRKTRCPRDHRDGKKIGKREKVEARGNKKDPANDERSFYFKNLARGFEQREREKV